MHLSEFKNFPKHKDPNPNCLSFNFQSYIISSSHGTIARSRRVTDIAAPPLRTHTRIVTPVVFLHWGCNIIDSGSLRPSQGIVAPANNTCKNASIDWGFYLPHKYGPLLLLC